MNEAKAKRKTCGCVPGFYTCGACEHREEVNAWRNMSEDKKNYDRHFDPVRSSELDRAMFDRETPE